MKDYFQSPKYLLQYEQEVYQAQGALPAAEVDQLITASETKFLTEARQALGPTIDTTAERVEAPTQKVRQARKRATKPT